MASDPVASLRPWPVEDIEIEGNVFRIRPLAAVEWLDLLLSERIDLWQIVPGLLEPDATDTVMDAMIEGRFDRDDLEDLVWEIVEVAAGRPWWTALYLMNALKTPGSGDLISGRLIYAGVDATRLSLAGWLDAVYAAIAGDLEPQERQKLDMALARPINPAKAKINRDVQRRNFMALMDTP